MNEEVDEAHGEDKGKVKVEDKGESDCQDTAAPRGAQLIMCTIFSFHISTVQTVHTV